MNTKPVYPGYCIHCWTSWIDKKKKPVRCPVCKSADIDTGILALLIVGRMLEDIRNTKKVK